MQMTIFTRILLYILFPQILIASIIFILINNIMHNQGEDTARQSAITIAEQISDHISDKLLNMHSSLYIIGKSLSNRDYWDYNARADIYSTLKLLLDSNPNLYHAWFAFEPGVFPNGERNIKAMIRKNGKIVESKVVTPELLMDKEKSPWYSYPLSTGKVYLDIIEKHQYTPEEGRVFVSSITYPIFSGSKVIGVTGVDMRYEDMFKSNFPLLKDQRHLMLLSPEGDIVYSTSPSDVKRNLSEFSLPNIEKVKQIMAKGTMLLEKGNSPFLEKKSITCLYPITIDEARRPIYLYMDLPLEELTAGYYSMLSAIMLMALCGLSLMIISAFYAASIIVKPIEKLTNAFNMLSEEDANSLENIQKISNIKISGNIRELDILQNALHKSLEQIRLSHELILKSAESKAEKEKLLAAFKAKNQVFANISHEIRTPMNAIIGIAEILLHDNQLTDQQRKYVNDIRMSSDSLLTIINDILDFYKLESGKMSLVPVNFNIQIMLDNICSLALYLADRKKLKFKYETKGELPLCFYGDDVRLRQILLNILSNAIKYTKEGSVTFCVTVSEQDLLFEISDTGIGIKKESQALLFAPFQQLDVALHRGIQGTGLGLAISKTLVELMGGKIELESVYGKGTTFRVTIPKTLGNESSMCQKTSNVHVAYDKSVRILVVDDNEINLRVAAGLLKSIYGLNSELAVSGLEAIEKAKAKDYDLIFMDHMMPGMDGVETTNYIRKIGERYNNVPIIALTANAVAGTREMLIKAGLDDFLAKPIRKNELAEMLYKYIPENKKMSYCLIDSTTAEVDIYKAPSTEYGAIINKVAAIDEVNISVGLDSFIGQEEDYEQALRLLNSKIKSITPLFEKLLEQHELKEFSIHIHGMKSALASIGAEKLSGMALSLEKASAANDFNFCNKFLPPFVRQMQSFSSQLEEAFSSKIESENSGEQRKAGDNSSLNAGLDSLLSALESYNYDDVTIRLQALMAQQYGESVETAIQKIKEQVDLFDYNAALQVLKSSFPDIALNKKSDKA